MENIDVIERVLEMHPFLSFIFFDSFAHYWAIPTLGHPAPLAPFLSEACSEIQGLRISQTVWDQQKNST